MKNSWIFFFLFSTAPVFASASHPQVCGLMNRILNGMSVVASNLSNVNTTRTPEGGPYLVRELICMAENCEIQQQDKVKIVYEPTHLDADSNGYVAYPDIDVTDEIAQMQMLVQIYEKVDEVCHVYMVH